MLVVHGTDDRIADPGRSAAMTKVLARTTTAGYLRVTGGKHAMLRHRSVFEGAATDFVRATLLGADVGRAGGRPAPRRWRGHGLNLRGSRSGWVRDSICGLALMLARSFGE